MGEGGAMDFRDCDLLRFMTGIRTCAIFIDDTSALMVSFLVVYEGVWFLKGPRSHQEINMWTWFPVVSE
ncbi:hypothetical protein MLD38_025397 [Melastoma candidum]|uniref:Uncharacterized protein n=1 Tax=Melastoma candidum TaxID=119954 RepID=A0ACB9NY44_9MYRT|nr:hypothetical protein MLD38_025397 [Melastoma candidum]